MSYSGNVESQKMQSSDMRLMAKLQADAAIVRNPGTHISVAAHS
jgi:hypothetical protein